MAQRKDYTDQWGGWSLSLKNIITGVLLWVGWLIFSTRMIKATIQIAGPIEGVW